LLLQILVFCIRGGWYCCNLQTRKIFVYIPVHVFKI